MFRKSQAQEIERFFDLPLKKNELAVFYLGVSGFIARSLSHTVLFDLAGMLKDDEVNALKTVNLVLFTHDHLDHFSSGKTQAIFKATAAPVLAEPKVANKLKGKIPADKLVSAESGKTYSFDGATATAIQGVHRGPIMLYQIKMDGITLFHGGDSGYVDLKDYPSQARALALETTIRTKSQRSNSTNSSRNNAIVHHPNYINSKSLSSLIQCRYCLECA